VRFASVYREFKDIHEFMEALSTLLKASTGAGTTPAPQAANAAVAAPQVGRSTRGEGGGG
jgi:hypothetical protein